MSTTFEDLKVYQKAHQVTLSVYKLTNSKLLNQDFALRDQMRPLPFQLFLILRKAKTAEATKNFFTS